MLVASALLVNRRCELVQPTADCHQRLGAWHPDVGLHLQDKAGAAEPEEVKREVAVQPRNTTVSDSYISPWCHHERLCSSCHPQRDRMMGYSYTCNAYSRQSLLSSQHLVPPPAFKRLQKNSIDSHSRAGGHSTKKSWWWWWWWWWWWPVSSCSRCGRAGSRRCS
jgi:hypothetical protein